MLLSLVVVLSASPVVVGPSTGVVTPPLIGTPSEAALRFAKSRPESFGLDTRSTLEVSKTLSTHNGAVVYLEQMVGGLRVNGARVIVTFDAQQRVVRTSSTAKSFSVAKLNATLSPQQAVAVASKEIEGAWLRADGTPYGGATKRAFIVNGELHVGYLTFVPTLKNSENWHVAVDATDGAVLWVQNRAWASHAANVYESSPKEAGVGVTPTLSTELIGLDGGFLLGQRVRALNCCPTENCLPDAGPARAQGQMQTFQGVIDIDVAICKQVNLATNDPLLHPSGDYVYAPVDPPNTAAPSINNPADYDEFAEVHAYHHVTKSYEVIRGLSSGPFAQDAGVSLFSMRDTGAGGGLPTVWVNVSDADLNSAQPNAQGVYVSNTLSRTENALYLARENMEYLLLPPQIINSDALVIYQAQRADFAYDGPVLWHEFGHGVIHSTADWGIYATLDAYSANNESSALNEGMADVISVMTSNNDPAVGVYVGPRFDPPRPNIRNVDNQLRCPDVLWGQQHQDSQHFTGAVWEARQAFMGTDMGKTYDAAVYAALVQFPSNVNFASATALIVDEVGRAFPEVTDARARVQSIFDSRGVTNCSKALDITDSLGTPREYFGIPGTSFVEVGNSQPVPGPFQFKIRLPNGARRITFSAQGFGGGGGGGSRLEILANVGERVTFVKNGSTLANDAQAKVVPTSSQGNISGSLDLDVPCGAELYLAVANTSTRDRELYNVAFDYLPALECEVVDAGVDAGVVDGGVDPVLLDAAQETLGAKVEGCGCSTVSPFSAFFLLAFALRRRASRR